ncbi:HlyD family efflux transporter periplasmic adaptor subunit [Hymenobacter lutimineralis]|uniref:HlyD family efflux transporter periplasmic adaptor subunit n=1 Tax=Hymenobacter lutimineralis TaxID=2606448 RepID=A0A5D6V298_9BACT|nr:HlyD family efflux transporter periplasmic adaptor subunit [Hymenobacter lutimineralis]TYZ08694.1 HlyD family efflux transporter periplasmic adaptor subunit [Hymenobacter lutimineralis]
MLHPTSIVPDTMEAYLPQVSVRSQLIYSIILTALLVLLCALPIVHVDVSVQSAGIIRPVGERNEIRPLVAGIVEKIRVRENQSVQAGDTLLQLKTDVVDTQLRSLRQQMAEKDAFIADISKLVRLRETTVLQAPALSSALYAQQYAQFRFQQQDRLAQRRKLQSELNVSRTLYAGRVISRIENQDKEYALQKLLNESRLQVENQLSQWQADLNMHRVALAELQTKEKQALQERRLYTLLAPVPGAVQQLAGKYPGSYVQVGEALGQISPNSALIAECYVTPKDIGQLRPGMKARFQIDAFDYNQWGMLEGKILEVAKDFTMLNDQPVFKVTCQLNQGHLSLPNGYQGRLKKGMTLRGRFMLAKRSLWQLLYDKADDWMNPTQFNR